MPTLAEFYQQQANQSPMNTQPFYTLQKPLDQSWFRSDGTQKGQGFMGPLPYHTGQTSTEISIGVDGREMPSLVPTLTPAEINHLLMGGKPTPAIIQKAVAHANMRQKAGQPVFAGPSDQPVQFGVPWRQP